MPYKILRSNVENCYRRYAPVYDFLFGPSFRKGHVAVGKLTSMLGHTNILEIGVGTGMMLYQYPSGARITGIDISPDMLAIANHRVRPEDRERITLQMMDAEAMDFADHSFDCVTVPYALSVTPNPDRMVAEIRRVCKPGGDIVIVNHFSGQSSSLWRVLEALTHPLAKWVGFRSKFSLERHVMQHSWRILSIAPTNFLNLSRLIHIKNVS
ncbi:MAG: class I SAM-dependent methyltransferase [Azonexus sp.]|jgi:phosphatidylethanolamine/phosphatidyl-N-methylethanolamine N-methyltransferase|uniref:class I SAM-dependent methyltransferase n=1 Tax=Azonexus sp. TaxID=1872668 RepID=UPI00281935F8|nr:class I SAM-dependent methyltransferase [Azonexus sp.]MDR0777543.1 class I SAM-dependent methyltransferase [Azonexus sp.]